MLKNIITNRFILITLIVVLIVIGVYSWNDLNIDAFPDVTNDQVMIITKAPGMSTEDVEKLISFPIEIQMAGLTNVKLVRSLSKPGLSRVTVIFEDGTDIYFARQIVFERLSAVKEKLPPGIDPEIGPISTGLGEIYQYTIESENYSLIERRILQDWVIAPMLKSIPGVNEVNSFGGFVKQYQILIDPEKLMKYDISFDDVIKAVSSANRNVAGNYIKQDLEAIYIRGVGIFRSISDIENIVLKSHEGSYVLLKHIGEVAIGHKVRYGAVTRDGKGETVCGMVIMLKGSNSKKVVGLVKEKIEDIKKILPKGVKIDTFYDRTVLIDNSINTIRDALLFGSLLVIIVIFLLVGEIKSAFIIAISLPLTSLLVFIVMNLLGLTGNLMSFSGLAIAIGIIVDGTIVVTENILRHIKGAPPGKNRIEVILNAVTEVKKPVIFSLFIIAIVMFPLFALQAMEGKMFKPLATTMIIALLASIFVAFVITPGLSILFHKSTKNEQSKKQDNFFIRGITFIYEKTLRWAFKLRWIIISIFIILFGITIYIIKNIGVEFLPPLDEGALAINIVRLPSASLESSIEVGTIVEKMLLKYPEVETVVTKTGRAEIAEDPMGTEQNDIIVILKPKSEWRKGMDRIKLIRTMEKELSMIPGIRVSFSQPIALRVNELVSGIKSDIAIKIFGDDIELLKGYGEEISQILSKIKGATDIKVEQVSGYLQLEIIPNYEEMAKHKVETEVVNTYVEGAIGGKVVGTFYEGERRFEILIRFKEDFRDTILKMKNLKIKTPLGYYVTLSKLADFKVRETPAQITRENFKRRLVVECNVIGRDINSFVQELKQKIKGVEAKLGQGYFIKLGGQFENQERAMRTLSILVPIGIFLIFTMLGFALGSLKSSILIMINLPFSIIGGIFALYYLNLYVSVSSVIGFIALFGLAVENGTVLVSFIEKRRKNGKLLISDIFDVARNRLKPILMTTFTTIFGLLPLILFDSPAALIQRPLAIVVLSGLIVSLIVTLYLIPIFYVIMFKKSITTVKSFKPLCQ